ncbi:MAG: transcriptional regulator [Xanthomonadales bacterium]|nr:transcriptional regulator [Xanthomonadales bacterium]
MSESDRHDRIASEADARTADGVAALDAVLEHRARLAVCVLLSRHDEISFARFKQLLELTDGNLGAQLRKLEESGYVTLRRTFEARKPVTWYALTDAGKRALKTHLSALQALVAAAEI